MTRGGNMVTPRIRTQGLTQLSEMIAEWRQFYPIEQRELLVAIGDDISSQMVSDIKHKVFPGHKKPIDDTGELAKSIGFDVGKGSKGPVLEVGINPQVQSVSRPDLRRQTIKEGPGMEPGSTGGLYWKDVEFGQTLQFDAPAQEFLGWHTEPVRERQSRAAQPTEGQLPMRGLGEAGLSKDAGGVAERTTSERNRPMIRSYNASDTDWASLEDWAYRKFSPVEAQRILGSLVNKMNEGIPTTPQPFFSTYAGITEDGEVTGLTPQTHSIFRNWFAEFVHNLSRFQRVNNRTGEITQHYAIRRPKGFKKGGAFTKAQGKIPASEMTAYPEFQRGSFRDLEDFQRVEPYVQQQYGRPFRGAELWSFGEAAQYPWSRFRPDLYGGAFRVR